MISDISLEIVKEGKTLIIVPADRTIAGPSSSEMPIFYNPQMEFSRDMSVAVLRNILPENASFLDGLAATGAVGIRIRNETDKGIKLHLNDRNFLSTDLIKKNLLLNNIEDAEITQDDLRALLLKRSYDCVDIDPFGTPVHFFPMAVEAVRNRGILSVTATDTGTISGIFPEACLRRYGIEVRRIPFCHEIGVRNLLGFVARSAARADRGIEPLLSFYADHYVRCFVRIIKGVQSANATLKKLGYCFFDPNNLDRNFCTEKSTSNMGPIWVASTCDCSFVENLHIPAHLGFVDRIAYYLSLLKGESAIQRPFFSVDELSRKLKLNPPKMSVLLLKLAELGNVSGTHFGYKTFKTDLSIEEIEKVMHDVQ